MRRMVGSVSVMVVASLGLLVSTGIAGTDQAFWTGEDRAGWLLERPGIEDLVLTGQQFRQGEIGGAGGGTVEVESVGTGGGKIGLNILASLVLPGAGEAMLGYKRGYFMMAADIFAWTQVAGKHSDGNDLRDEYYAFADEHWSEDRLWRAYGTLSDDPYIGGLGHVYIDGVEVVSGVEGLQDNLPLWVTREADEREYYENLGKWDQFVFGWDDFVSPEDGAQLYGYEVTETLADLRQSWTSPNRDEYREMRDASNDAFKSRDRWLYLNIGLRVFSVVQTAYLGGLMGGGPAQDLAVAGHPVKVVARTGGWDRGAVAAIVSF